MTESSEKNTAGRRLEASIKAPKFSIVPQKRRAPPDPDIPEEFRALATRLGLPPDPEDSQDAPVQIPEEFRAAEANRALRLGFARDDIPIRRAFQKFSLDPQNPWHWRLLLFYLTTSGTSSALK